MRDSASASADSNTCSWHQLLSIWSLLCLPSYPLGLTTVMIYSHLYSAYGCGIQMPTTIIPPSCHPAKEQSGRLAPNWLWFHPRSIKLLASETARAQSLTYHPATLCVLNTIIDGPTIPPTTMSTTTWTLKRMTWEHHLLLRGNVRATNVSEALPQWTRLTHCLMMQLGGGLCRNGGRGSENSISHIVITHSVVSMNFSLLLTTSTTGKQSLSPSSSQPGPSPSPLCGPGFTFWQAQAWQSPAWPGTLLGDSNIVEMFCVD